MSVVGTSTMLLGPVSWQKIGCDVTIGLEQDLHTHHVCALGIARICLAHQLQEFLAFARFQKGPHSTREPKFGNEGSPQSVRIRRTYWARLSKLNLGSGEATPDQGEHTGTGRRACI